MTLAISYPPIPIFELGPLQLSLHGLFAGLGYVVGAALMVREARRRGFDDEKVISVLTWALVASMLGARFFTVPAHMFDPGYGFSDAIYAASEFETAASRNSSPISHPASPIRSSLLTANTLR